MLIWALIIQMKNKMNPIDYKRGYIRALFLEDEKWINCIEKNQMIVPGNRLNKIDNRRDTALKEKLYNQVHPDTYQQRKKYFEAWVNAKCCADDCDKYCDECHGIKFEPVPKSISMYLDADVRRFIEKYQRFWLKSEQSRGEQHDIRRRFPDKKDGDDVMWIRERKGPRLSGKQEENASNPFEGQAKMFLRP